MDNLEKKVEDSKIEVSIEIKCYHPTDLKQLVYTKTDKLEVRAVLCPEICLPRYKRIEAGYIRAEQGEENGRQ